jgi:Spy/CpxP family protein refolding chaperone
MMAGNGPGYGMGPGMMGGYGMGPGMMAGNGPGYGMGPGMMAGYGPGASCHGGYDLDLTAEQRSKLASIQNDLAPKQIERMSALHDERFKLRDLYAAPQRDDNAIGASRERLGKLQREMHQAALEGRKAFEAVLTPEQREEVRRGWVGAHMF